MGDAWEGLVGIPLPQGYCLEKCLDEEDGAALYLASRSVPAEQEPRRAWLKLVTGHAAVPGQLAAWERLAGLSHPNVLALLDCGRSGPMGPDAGHFLYAALEYPDDRLAPALEGGVLSESDARAVLAAVEAGLQFLHAHGLAHTSVDPRHIVAIGDRIKLSGDTVKPLGPAATEAADWKALGRLRSGRLGAPEAAPGGAAPAPESLLDDTTELRRTMPFWAYAGGAVAMVLVLLLILVGRPKPVAAPQPLPVAQPLPAPYVAPQVRAVEKTPPASHPAEPANWRVVAYTYMRRKDADHKAAQIGARFPGFAPEVFAPKGGGRPPYLVSLGGRMTRAQARTLQRQALAKGMPQGTYLQNFTN
jgi:hypothetical protein